MKQVLFLCTGNYYRSRFAERLFNALAGPARLGWQAASRGLHPSPANIGPLSPDAASELARRGIAPEAAPRFPLQLQESDLRQADLIIALNEAEHRPLLQARFPGWEARAHYWHIPDLGEAPASRALPEAEREVRALVQRLLDGRAPSGS